MTLTKASTRPIVCIELVSGWIAMILTGLAVPQAYEFAVIGALGVFFGDRVMTHRLGDKA